MIGPTKERREGGQEDVCTGQCTPFWSVLRFNTSVLEIIKSGHFCAQESSMSSFFPADPADEGTGELRWDGGLPSPTCLPTMFQINNLFLTHYSWTAQSLLERREDI